MSWFSNVKRFFGLYPFEDLFNKWGFRFLNPSPQFNDYTKDVEKLNIIFRSPAVLKVFALQCDLFSLGNIYVYRNDNEVKDDPALTRLNNPNPFQTKRQFLWDYMFWNMVGTAYAYVDSDLVDKDNNKLYFLDVTKLEFPPSLAKIKDKLVFSTKAEREIGDTLIKYRYGDGTFIEIPLKKIIILTDLTNGLGNWFKSPSRIDALYKVVSNSEAALDAKNINTRFTGKFVVAGKADPDNVTELPMSKGEKETIEKKINDDEPVHAVKSMIDIKRFVENLKQLQLGAAFLEDYFLVGSMYGIPRDVLEAYNSATYENQEKARGSHVSYCLEPKGEDFMAALCKRWGYDDKKLVISWDHLPFMQVFEGDRADVKAKNVETFVKLIELGVSAEEANKYLDLNFNIKTDGKATD